MPRPWDAIVVGGGVVGCAVLRELTVGRGLRCLLVEASQHLVAGASSGNTGIACTASDVAPGTIEHACLSEGTKLNLPTYRQLNVPHRPTGTIYVAYSHAERETLEREQALRTERGDDTPRLLTASEALEREPALAGSSVVGALLLPGETVVDPWLVPMAYARHAHENGAEIRRGTEVVAAVREHDLWRLTLSSPSSSSAEAETIEAEAHAVVACGGLRGDHLEGLHRAPPFGIRPRRGDYVLYDGLYDDDGSSTDGSAAASAAGAGAVRGETPVGQVPSATSRGVYVWRSVLGVLACGPTAEDVDPTQRATPPRPTDDAVREALHTKAARALPALGGAVVSGTYAGLRPASDASPDYQIGVVRGDGSGGGGGGGGAGGSDGCGGGATGGAPWVTVGGIRSTGLTASLGIAKHVARLVCDDAAFAATTAATAAAMTAADATTPTSPPPKKVHTTPLPDVESLVASFRARGDGTVVFGDDATGFGAHYVTHPLTRTGLERLASDSPI